MRHEVFITTNHSRICEDYFISLEYYPSSRMLSKTSPPPAFDFPQYLQKDEERRQLKRKAPYIEGQTVNKEPSFLKGTKLSPPKAELKDFIQEQRKGIKTPKQKVKWQQRKIDSLSGLLEDLKERTLIDQNYFFKIEQCFVGFYNGYDKNQIHNQDRDPRSFQYSDKVKKFALTLNFYSPRAYEYLRCFSLTAYQFFHWVGLLDKLWTEFLHGSTNWPEPCS